MNQYLADYLGVQKLSAPLPQTVPGKLLKHRTARLMKHSCRLGCFRSVQSALRKIPQVACPSFSKKLALRHPDGEGIKELRQIDGTNLEQLVHPSH